MKDLSFCFLFKSSLAGKMKKSYRTFCNNDGSTSTLNRKHKLKRNSNSNNSIISDNHHDSFNYCGTTTTTTMMGSDSNSSSRKAGSAHDCHKVISSKGPTRTLEEMILELEIEEEMEKREAKLKKYYSSIRDRGRMSCVSNSDILRSARNALNQYPRFSLDGKDAMYRSSFRNNKLDFAAGHVHVHGHGNRKSSAAGGRSRNRQYDKISESSSTGYRIHWCKPGVVAKLMGLEAMPITMSTHNQLIDFELKGRDDHQGHDDQILDRRFHMPMTTTPSSS